jgi:hypothetical protein
MGRIKITSIKTDGDLDCCGLRAVHVAEGDSFCVVVNRDHLQFRKI